MPSSYSGRYRYHNPADSVDQSGSCRLVIEEQNLQVIPEKGLPIAMDLADIEAYLPGDYELTLKIYDGSELVLSHFAKTFQNLASDLLSAYRERTIKCLLLEDLEESARFEGIVRLESQDWQFSSRSEIRLYRSNLAILPERAAGMQWRLADIDAIEFDEPNHALNLRSSGDLLVLAKLAKRTGELEKCLRSSLSKVSEESLRVIQRIFPFLSPGQIQKLAGIFKEGRAANISEMELVHPGIGRALVEQTIGDSLRPYFDALRQRSVEQECYAGFKLIRKEAQEGEMPGESEESPDQENLDEEADSPPMATEEEAQPVIHWCFFPIRGKQGLLRNIVAWEVVSRGGRATYFFRMVPREQEELLQDPSRVRTVVGAGIRRLNQALVVLNFRREPIYLKDESLEMQPRYRRYAIACRKMPVLRQLRGAFLGRAIHASMQDWEGQVSKILAGD